MQQKTSTPGDESGGVSTVSKAIEVLDLVHEFGRPVRFRELEAASRFPKPTLYRFVQSLTDHGMLNFDPDRSEYYLGTRLVRLAHAAWRQSMIAPVARPHLKALADRLGEAVYLSGLDGGQCVCLDRGSPDDLAGAFLDINRVYPTYCTAVGKAMLASLPEAELNRALARQSFARLTQTTITDECRLRGDLDQVRVRGFAIEDEEHVRGIIAVGVPIVADTGTLLGGLGVHAPDRRTDLESLVAQVPHMQATAAEIARDAADWRRPSALEPSELRKAGT